MELAQLAAIIARAHPADALCRPARDHGADPDAWRSATPKAKFMIINLPFKQIMVKKLIVKKKPVMAIYADEAGGSGMVSATFWDGKKYKYQPLGSSMQ